MPGTVPTTVISLSPPKNPMKIGQVLDSFTDEKIKTQRNVSIRTGLESGIN